MKRRSFLTVYIQIFFITSGSTAFALAVVNNENIIFPSKTGLKILGTNLLRIPVESAI